MRAGWLTLIALIAAVLVAGCSVSGGVESQVASERPLSDRLSLGHSHSCVIDADDKLHCWGNNDYGQTTVPDPEASFVAVSAGSWHTCAINDNDNLQCWGVNNYGQNNVPDPSASYRAVSAGESFTCAIRSADGKLECWGDNANGQATVPDADVSYASVAAGLYHACAIRSGTGQLECWGGGGGYDAGQLTVPDATASYSQVTAGFYHTCAIRTADSGLECWGDNFYGQIDVPDADAAYDFVSAGTDHACAMRSNTGQVKCWGDNTYGQKTAPAGGYRILAAGGEHSCAVADDNSLSCWGSDDFRQATTPTGLTMSLPLLLRLSAEPTCETTKASGGSDLVAFRTDDDKVDARSRATWTRVNESPVDWSVSGGSGTYSLTIDGESGDPNTTYQGRTGTASVSCALDFGEWEPYRGYDRWYRKYLTESVVDSGWKTIYATVTDSSGATAKAETQLYVIRITGASGTVLKAGHTYRVHGQLITIPDGQDAEIGGYELAEGGRNIFDIYLVGANYYAAVSIAVRSGDVIARGIEWSDDATIGSPQPTSNATTTDTASSDDNQFLLDDEISINARIDDLVDSIGQLPQPRTD